MSAYEHLGVAVRLAWRRHRIFYLVWVYALALTLPATAMKYHTLVPVGSDPASLMTSLAGNPSMRFLLGPAFDLSTAGGFTFWRVGTFCAAGCAMMAALGVIRSTRAEEEEGRTELLRAGAIGRGVPFAAGLVLAVAMCLVTGAVVAVAMVLVGTPVAGSLATGLGLALTGTMWAGVGGLAAQAFESARAARGWALGLGLGGLYVLRGIIDGAGPGAAIEPARWAMPFDWAALARPYAHERWWVFLLPLTFTAVTCGLALHLDAGRDLGAGLWATRAGSASAAPWLNGAGGLAWRLQRGSVLAWVVGVCVSALGIGSMVIPLDQTLTKNPQVGDMLRRIGGGAADAKISFHQAMLAIMATVAALCAITMVARLRQEEVAGRAEVMLATSIPRQRFLDSHLRIATVVSAGLLLASGALLPCAQALHDGSAHLVWTFLKAALVMLPGLVVLIGVSVALLGWAPRLFGVVWVVLGWSVLVSWILPLFNLPHWLLRLHPWGHLPHLPTDHMSWPPVLVESALGVVLWTVGVLGYRRRNIPAG